MENRTFLNKKEYQKTSLNYEALRSLGITGIQRYSGSTWTDYNYHDPGITILEAFCYSLTDLAYRTNFEIPKLFQVRPNDPASAFASAERVMRHAPSTLIDIEEALVAVHKEASRVWVKYETSSTGIRNLVSVYVEPVDDLLEFERQTLSKAIREGFLKIRPLGIDIKEVVLLDPVLIGVAMSLHFHGAVLPETIVAGILADFHSLVHATPHKQKGTADDKSATQNNRHKRKLNELQRVSFESVLQATTEIREIGDFLIFKNSVQQFKEVVTCDVSEYFKFEYEAENIRITKNGIAYTLDVLLLKEQFQQCLAAQKESILEMTTKEASRSYAEAYFTSEELGAYFALQNDLPIAYGTTSNGTTQRQSDLAKTSRLQLKGFLLLIEQLMANHLSVLSGLNRVFNFDNNLLSFKIGAPTDVHDLDQLLEHPKAYIQRITDIFNQTYDYDHLFTDILDHMLLRFGETHQFNPSYLNDNEIRELKAKYLKSIVSLGYEKATAASYSRADWNEYQPSGLENRLYKFLGINRPLHRSLLKGLKEEGAVTKRRAKTKWANYELKPQNGLVITVLASLDSYKRDAVVFYLSKGQDTKILFEYGVHANCYKILDNVTLDNQKIEHVVLFTPPSYAIPVVVALCSDKDNAKALVEKAREKMVDFNKISQGFHMIEHIMLRPRTRSLFRFQINANDEVLLESTRSDEFNLQQQQLKEALVLGKRKERYSILSANNNKRFTVVLYDTKNSPMARIPKTFYSNVGAQAALEACLKVLQATKDTDLKSKVTKDESMAHQFPNEFNYDNELSFVLPEWTTTFNNNEAINTFKDMVVSYVPGHIKVNFYALSMTKMLAFEILLKRWVPFYVTHTDSVKLDARSLTIIQFLSKEFSL